MPSGQGPSALLSCLRSSVHWGVYISPKTACSFLPLGLCVFCSLCLDHLFLHYSFLNILLNSDIFAVKLQKLSLTLCGQMMFLVLITVGCPVLQKCISSRVSVASPTKLCFSYSCLWCWMQEGGEAVLHSVLLGPGWKELCHLGFGSSGLMALCLSPLSPQPRLAPRSPNNWQQGCEVQWGTWDVWGALALYLCVFHRWVSVNLQSLFFTTHNIVALSCLDPRGLDDHGGRCCIWVCVICPEANAGPDIQLLV